MSCTLVCGLTQSRKTRKTFDVLEGKIRQRERADSGVAVIFITQANCTVSASQVISRAKEIDYLRNVFGESISRRDTDARNHFIVDFWNSRNMDKITEFIEIVKSRIGDIFIVIDEADSGSKAGLLNRLLFVQDIEKRIGQRASLILVTATVANLSKSVLTIAESAGDIFSNPESICHTLLFGDDIEYAYVQPSDNYIGPSWFLENVERLNILKFPKKTKEETRDEWIEKRMVCIERALRGLDDEDRELSLIVVATKREHHGDIASRLLDNCGYNVIVELNSENIRNYVVIYKNADGGITEWAIPFARIERMADKGELASWQCGATHRFKETGIANKDDITLSHVLQAALFMKTTGHHDRVLSECCGETEIAKLMVLSEAMRRPRNYPQVVRVALIAGHLASRGNTIQNGMIGFVCTSHCFTDTMDAAQRGAINAQRFGRVCGMLRDVYERRGKYPVFIGTSEILRDAFGNEKVLVDKSGEDALTDGDLISLKTFISSDEWSRLIRKSRKHITDVAERVDRVEKERQRTRPKPIIRPRIKLQETKQEDDPQGEAREKGRTAIMEQKVIDLLKSAPNNTMELSNAVLSAVDSELNDFVKSQKRRLFTAMASKGLLVNIEPKKGIWKLVQ